jgi:hypothetical protein
MPKDIFAKTLRTRPLPAAEIFCAYCGTGKETRPERGFAISGGVVPIAICNVCVDRFKTQFAHET